MKNKSNPNDLTDEEIAFLRNATLPDEVKDYLARQHENVGTKITAFRKVAAAARAECEAILATRDLALARSESVDLAVAKKQIAGLQAEVRQLEGTITAKDREIMAKTATPALAVHSSD